MCRRTCLYGGMCIWRQVPRGVASEPLKRTPASREPPSTSAENGIQVFWKSNKLNRLSCQQFFPISYVFLLTTQRDEFHSGIGIHTAFAPH